MCRHIRNTQIALKTVKTAVIRIAVKNEIKMIEAFKLAQDKTVKSQAEINTIPLKKNSFPAVCLVFTNSRFLIFPYVCIRVLHHITMPYTRIHSSNRPKSIDLSSPCCIVFLHIFDAFSVHPASSWREDNAQDQRCYNAPDEKKLQSNGGGWCSKGETSLVNRRYPAPAPRGSGRCP